MRKLIFPLVAAGALALLALTPTKTQASWLGEWLHSRYDPGYYSYYYLPEVYYPPTYYDPHYYTPPSYYAAPYYGRVWGHYDGWHHWDHDWHRWHGYQGGWYGHGWYR